MRTMNRQRKQVMYIMNEGPRIAYICLWQTSDSEQLGTQQPDLQDEAICSKI